MTNAKYPIKWTQSQFLHVIVGTKTTEPGAKALADQEVLALLNYNALHVRSRL